MARGYEQDGPTFDARESEKAVAALREKLSGPMSSQKTIAQQLDELEEAIGQLGDRLELLENRLYPVLGPDYPEDENAKSPSPEGPRYSPVGTTIEAHANQVRRLRRGVVNLLDRLEL